VDQLAFLSLLSSIKSGPLPVNCRFCFVPVLRLVISCAIAGVIQYPTTTTTATTTTTTTIEINMNSSDSYSGRALFKSQPEHHLPLSSIYVIFSRLLRSNVEIGP
jgi:hypothetical protein